MDHATKLVITVEAGLILGEPMKQYTRTWEITSGVYARMTDRGELSKPEPERSKEWHDARYKWLSAHGVSREYQAALENPGALNWVTRTWIWM
jgi:hypothetical protein